MEGTSGTLNHLAQKVSLNYVIRSWAAENYSTSAATASNIWKAIKTLDIQTTTTVPFEVIEN